MINESTVRSWALEAGFCEAAFCSTKEFDEERRVVSQQAPLAERRQLRFDPREDDQRIKSLCVLLWPYPPAEPAQGGSVFVDSYYYASNAAYHAARALEERLIRAGHYAKANVSYPAKRAAVRAGLGIIGLNSLLITKEHGTRVVIILIATDIEPECGDAVDDKLNSCLLCGRCAEACPSGALSKSGMCSPEKCLRNFTMEGIVIPEETRKQIGMRLIGCDVCQRVCPMQPQSGLSSGAGQRCSLDSFVTCDTAQFSKSVAELALEIGRNAARPQRVRAQAALLAGNIRDPRYLPVLREWAQSDFPAVREHAVWAIAQIEGCDMNC